MVEANPWGFPPLPEDEASLQDYLDCLVKDRLLPGANYLLESRVKTCQMRVKEFSDLRVNMVISTSAAELTDIVNTKQDQESMYRDGGVFDLTAEDYVQMKQNDSLNEYLDKREQDLERDLKIAEHRNANDKPKLS